jgi:hypothetical protein
MPDAHGMVQLDVGSDQAKQKRPDLGRTVIVRGGSHQVIAPRRKGRNPAPSHWTSSWACLDRGQAARRRAGAPSGFGDLDPRDRAFVRLLLATTLRRLGEIDEVLGA